MPDSGQLAIAAARGDEPVRARNLILAPVLVLTLLPLLVSAGPLSEPPVAPAVDDGVSVRPISLQVFPDVAVRPINPLSYGVNEGALESCPLRRHGGNRFTGFNWETSASNAGSDYLQHSDYYLAPEEEARGPGELLARRLAADQQRGARSLVTLQLAGYVSADVAGTVEAGQTAPSERWHEVRLEPSPIRVGGPDLEDDRVYLDEQVRDLVRRFGRAEDGGVLAYALDNEPALWSHTHPRLHPEPASYAEVVEKGIAAARLVTTEDPSAQVFGPVLYGWAAFHDLQGAPDARRHRLRHPTFVDHYLASLAEASEQSGRRLLHRLDIHWYPEAVGDERVVTGDTSPATVAARVQAPRSLWDADYRESSWIVDVIGEPVALIPRMKRSIDAHFPGTGLAITEYNFGAAGHISGGLAQVDALGIFGRNDVVACYWSLGGEQAWVDAAFRLYLDFDGQGGRFGELSVHALSSDVEASTVHAARRDGDPRELTVVALNKSFDTALDADIALSVGSREIESVSAWRLAGERPEIVPVEGGVTVSGHSVRDQLPPASATLYVVRLSELDV